MPRNIILSILLCTLSSCVILNTPGFYSGYKKLSPAEKSQIIFASPEQNVCGLPNDKKLYSITAAQLLNCLRSNDTSLVYFWSPNCHSEVCISLPTAQHYCNRHNYKLYVVAQYYDFEKTNPQNTNPLPIFTANHKHYGTDYCNAYNNRFLKELRTDANLPKDDRYDRFYFFKSERLIFTKNSIVETKNATIHR